MELTNDTKDKMIMEADKLASIIAGYYAALLANGVNEPLAAKLTAEFQSLLISRLLNNSTLKSTPP